jgi:hypothetical protein
MLPTWICVEESPTKAGQAAADVTTRRVPSLAWIADNLPGPLENGVCSVEVSL